MGYLIIDNRAAGGELQEYDTCSCVHCQAVIKIVRRQTRGVWCWRCAGPVCEMCAKHGRCEPFFRKVEQQLNRQIFFRQIGGQ